MRSIAVRYTLLALIFLLLPATAFSAVIDYTYDDAGRLVRTAYGDDTTVSATIDHRRISGSNLQITVKGSLADI